MLRLSFNRSFRLPFSYNYILAEKKPWGWQKVTLRSEVCYKTKDVSQESIGGPLLYNIYTSDCIIQISHTFMLLTGDTQLY